MMRYQKTVEKFEDLKYLELEKVTATKDEMFFHITDGRVFRLYHSQDCCEDVNIEDITGDLEDLVGEVLMATEAVGGADSLHPPPEGRGCDSYLWTFYRIGTVKGTVVVRWFGESNGYYSEGVSFEEVDHYIDEAGIRVELVKPSTF